MEALSQLVEESNSDVKVGVALNQNFGKEKLENPGRRHADCKWASTVCKHAAEESYNRCCAETTTELEALMDNLGKLKLDVASLSAEKSCAEKELEAINSKMCSSLRSLEKLQREMDEVNEEQVLVELARIEAVKEFKSISAQKEKETKEFSAAMEITKEKIKESIQEIDRAKELKAALAHMTADTYISENELKLIHGEDKKRSGRRAGSGKASSLVLQEIREELVSAKKDLNSVREEGFQLMASIDITRDELKQAKEETLQVKRAQDKTDSALQLLNSKLLRARAKLKESLAEEEKTKSVVSGISSTLEQLKSESEAAKKERKLIGEEAASIRARILELDKGIDLRGETFEAAIEELEAVKLSEETALANLRTVAGIAATERASSFASQCGNSSITLSRFEYEYLKGRAGAAQDVADEKAAAARAWVEALKASEEEMLMRIEMGEREIRKIAKRQELRNNRRQKSQKSRRDGSFQVQVASPRRATRDHGYSIIMTPVRRTRLRNSTSSPASQPMCYTVKKRRAMPRLAKLFAKSNKKEAQAA